MATIVLALTGCLNRPEPRETSLVFGELPYECVWSSCSAPSLALSRCTSKAGGDALAFQYCMRDEGYQPFECKDGTPGCTPRLQVLH